MRIQSILVLIAATTVSISLTTLAADKEDAATAAPKYEFEEIMKKGMKGDDSLLKKLIGGSATDEEKETFVAYCESLCQLEPSEGDAESWKKKTTALLTAARDAANGKADAAPTLEKAANCKACHSIHKPKTN